MCTPLSQRVRTWLNASEISGTCDITQVNETSHHRLLCKQLQTARSGTWCDALPWTVFECLLAVGNYLCAHRNGWEGRRGERSHGWVWRGVEPRACSSLASSTESWLWPRAHRSCEPHPERGNAGRGAWNVLILSTAAIQRHRVLLWLRWQALLLNWTQRFGCGSTLTCLYSFCGWTGVLIWDHIIAVDVLGPFGACGMPLDPLLIPALAFLNLFSEPWCL